MESKRTKKFLKFIALRKNIVFKPLERYLQLQKKKNTIFLNAVFNALKKGKGEFWLNK